MPLPNCMKCHTWCDPGTIADSCVAHFSKWLQLFAMQKIKAGLSLANWLECPSCYPVIGTRPIKSEHWVQFWKRHGQTFKASSLSTFGTLSKSTALSQVNVTKLSRPRQIFVLAWECGRYLGSLLLAVCNAVSVLYTAFQKALSLLRWQMHFV